MADDSLHEVQLNGKQLVFLFMVGTVIAVVIFLCGVLVGRGLRPGVGSLELAAADSASTIDPTQSLPPASSGSTPSGGTPVSASEDLGYKERLESASPPDDLREPARPVAEPTAAAPPPPAPEPATRKPEPAASAPKPAAPPVPGPATAAAEAPGGKGFVVQVMAVNIKTEADAVAKRLTAKGFPTFVTTTGAGAKLTYRVRVGTYDTQREAEAIAARLLKEEQFKPWVTRSAVQ
jgi:cell division septation protein DedD